MRNARWRERARLVRWWRLWRSSRPTTFTEKVRYKMLRDHRRLLITFADKAAMRDYVTSIVGQRHLPTLYALLDHPADLVDLDLPDRYVVKPTHGSGAVVVVSSDADPNATLPSIDACWAYTHVRPERADRSTLVDISQYWIEQLYGQGPNREWAYGAVPRRILVEEMLVKPNGKIADDYKLFVFHGRCEFVQVDAGRFERRSQDFYRRPWEWLPLSGGLPHSADELQQPECLAEMIEIAERLASDTDFLRVDLYVVDSRILVGELTSYPAGGDSPVHPESFDAEFGQYWTVPRAYLDRDFGETDVC